ncbi:MAG: ATP-binding protein [Anaerolineae bacterium]|jgi:serine/threonine-protein kinase RsbW
MATLTVFADFEQLATIRDFVASVGRDLGLAREMIYDLQLAVDEACANVIKHAYGGQEGKLKVTVEPVGDTVQVIIRDWGSAFDPQAVPIPDVSAPLEDRPLGGLGLFLMRQMMDRVDFEFDQDRGNTLTMTKKRQGRK